MKTELGKLSNNNLIALDNFLSLIAIRTGFMNGFEFYEYRGISAEFSLMYPMHKEKDLMHNIQEIALSSIEYEIGFNHEDIACLIETDIMCSVSRNRLIDMLEDNIMSLLKNNFTNVNQKISLEEAISRIASLVDSKSLLNRVKFLA